MVKMKRLVNPDKRKYLEGVGPFLAEHGKKIRTHSIVIYKPFNETGENLIFGGQNFTHKPHWGTARLFASTRSFTLESPSLPIHVRTGVIHTFSEQLVVSANSVVIEVDFPNPYADGINTVLFNGRRGRTTSLDVIKHESHGIPLDILIHDLKLKRSPWRFTIDRNHPTIIYGDGPMLLEVSAPSGKRKLDAVNGCYVMISSHEEVFVKATGTGTLFEVVFY